MAKGPDPRAAPASPAEVPALLAEGAREFNERRFWHAHEAWETAWHALRAAGREADAGYVRGMILVAAALENALRGKEEGFKRQFAEGLHALHGHRVGAPLVDAPAWEDALAQLYADACRRREWAWWRDSPWVAPTVELRGP